MPTHKRLVTAAIEEAEETEDAATRVVRHWERAMTDGRISPEEAQEGLRLAQLAVAEARDVVVATVKTDVYERAAISLLAGDINPHVRRQADEMGVVIPFPQSDAPEAA